MLPHVALKTGLDYGEIARRGFQSPDALAQRVYLPMSSVGRHGCSGLCDHQILETWLGNLVVGDLTFFIALDEN